MYRFYARSLSDPNGENGGLGFNSLEKAEAHKDRMNSLIEQYENQNSIWNKGFWETKPKPWIVLEK